MTTLKVKDSQGLAVKGWAFRTFKAIQVGNSLEKPRNIRGWELISHDGYVRCCEGNWQQFVPFAQLIISNYGFTSTLS
jgi:hypothetical protein